MKNASSLPSCQDILLMRPFWGRSSARDHLWVLPCYTESDVCDTPLGCICSRDKMSSLSLLKNMSKLFPKVWPPDCCQVHLCPKSYHQQCCRNDKLPSFGEANMILEFAAAQTKKKAPHLTHPLYCLEAIKHGIEHGGQSGMRKVSNLSWRMADHAQSCRPWSFWRASCVLRRVLQTGHYCYHNVAFFSNSWLWHQKEGCNQSSCGYVT